jgi:protein O-mannosyl-transferase
MSKRTQKPTSTPNVGRVLNPADVQVNLIGKYFPYLIAAIGFIAYANTLGHGYVLDDPLILEQNKYVTKGFGGIMDLFFKAYRAEVADGAATGFLYRPLSPVFFAIEWALGGGKPFLFHFMQVVWYAATCSLVYLTLRSLLRDTTWMVAAAASVLFAVHPLHTEVVANIKSRDEVLALFFVLGSLYSWLHWRDGAERKWLIFSLLSFFLALLSKESAITALPAFVLADYIFRARSLGESLKGLAIAAAPVLLFLGLRAVVQSGFSGAQSFDVMDNPIVGASGFAERSATGFMVVFEYVKRLFVPNPLLCDYSYNQLPLVNWLDARAILGMLLFAGLTIWGVFGGLKRNALAFFALTFIASIVLYSQLILVIGTLFGERLMFMPSLWFCGGFALLMSQYFGEKQTLIFSGLVGLLFLFLTIQRNGDWKDNLALFSADAQKAPNSVRLHNGVSSENYKTWVAQGRKPADLPKLSITMKQHSADANAIKSNPVSYINIGLALLEEKNYAGAEVAFNQALELSPNLNIAKQNLIVTYLNWGKVEARERNNFPEAIRIFEAALKLGYQGADVLQDLGTAYALNMQPQKAIPYFERCIALGSTDAALLRNLELAKQAIK